MSETSTPERQLLAAGLPAPAASRAPATWARRAAWGAVACVVPSGVWRVAVGFGVDLGWSQRQLERQQLPGSGTLYVLALSVVAVGAAALTLALVRPVSERVPTWVPFIGGRSLPLSLVVGISLAGSVIVAWISLLSVVNWHRVSGFADQPSSGWEVLMVACYAPALLWAPLLAAVTVEYWHRRRRARSRGAPLILERASPP